VEAAGAIPEFLKITGITDPDVTEPMLFRRMANLGGLPAWESTNQGTEWTVTPGGGGWNLTENDDGFYSAVSPAGASPVGLTGWTIETGTGQPTIQAYLPDPSAKVASSSIPSPSAPGASLANVSIPSPSAPGETVDGSEEKLVVPGQAIPAARIRIEITGVTISGVAKSKFLFSPRADEPLVNGEMTWTATKDAVDYLISKVGADWQFAISGGATLFSGVGGADRYPDATTVWTGTGAGGGTLVTAAIIRSLTEPTPTIPAATIPNPSAPGPIPI
jgi:hypothetical protein